MEQVLTSVQIEENERFAKQRMDPDAMKQLLEASKERSRRLSREDSESNYSKKRRWLLGHPTAEGRQLFGFQVPEPKPWKS